MIKINLREYYPFLNDDYFIEVKDIIVNVLHNYELDEATYMRHKRRHKAYFSLDRNDGIERKSTLAGISPLEIYERKITSQALNSALNNLSEKQARRIYAHYFFGMSKVAIAKMEGVSEYTIRDSIKRGLRNLNKILKDFR